jgi:hypothetical protein
MSTTKMITSHTTRSIEDYLDDFAGRIDMEGYDDSKRIHIAEENRDFVWPREMWEDLIKSIFAGYTIPLMVICDDQLMDGGNRSTVLMLWRNNKFTVKFNDWEGNYDAMIAKPTLAARWNRCVIPLTIITDATREERSQIYENYNKGIVLSTGQLLYNRKYRPLVKLASAMIGREGTFPFTDLIHRVWKKSWKKTKTLSELAFAYQVIVGSVYGSNEFHLSFQRHLDKLMSVEDDDIDLSNLQFICETMRDSDPDNSVAPKKKELVFKKFIGPMIYDVHTLSRNMFVEKWRAFCTRAYTTLTPEEFKALADTGTSRATNQSRIQRLSTNVAKLLNGTNTAVPNDDGNDSGSDEDSD